MLLDKTSTKSHIVFLAVFLFLSSSACFAGSIDTDFLEKDWPKQRTHEYEVGKHKVAWRHRVSSYEGIFAGAKFTAPSSLQKTWDVATDYSDIGKLAPEVEKVTWLERSENRKVIQIDIKVLWKTLTLKFEIEQEPQEVIRFRLVNEVIGEYRGIFRMREGEAGTYVDMNTWLNTSVKLPAGLLLWAQRSTMLSGIKNFLKACESTEGKKPGSLDKP
jgi:hypothetical protein